MLGRNMVYCPLWAKWMLKVSEEWRTALGVIKIVNTCYSCWSVCSLVCDLLHSLFGAYSDKYVKDSELCCQRILLHCPYWGSGFGRFVWCVQWCSSLYLYMGLLNPSAWIYCWWCWCQGWGCTWLAVQWWHCNCSYHMVWCLWRVSTLGIMTFLIETCLVVTKLRLLEFQVEG